MGDKFLLAWILGGVFFMSIFSIALVDAGATQLATNSLANKSNQTGTITNITCTSTLGNVTNMSFWVNASAHGSVSAVTRDLIGSVANTSGINQTTNFSILNVDVSGLADADTYSVWCMAEQRTTGTQLNSSYYNITNVTIDNTAPIVKVYSPSGVSISHDNATVYKNTAKLTLNVSVYDFIGLADSAFCFFDVNLSNETVSLNKSNRSHGWCNTSQLNLTNMPDGVNISNVYANDSLGKMQLNNSVYVLIDTSNPSATVSCTPSNVVEGSTVTCSCSGSDSVSSVNSTSDDETPSTLAKGTFTYTCTVTDQASNSVSQDATYTVVDSAGSSSSGGGGGGGGGTTSATNVNIFTKVTPGKASVMKTFNKDTGIKEIQIEVNNEAQNVKITVSKYSGKPAAVSVAKSGEVYQYLEVKASNNLEGNLKKATVTVKVEKSWLSDNGISNENVVVSKFDEENGEWNELTTVFDSEDEIYSYFTVELDSFSFFAISEKVVVEEEEEDPGVVDDVLEGLGITSNGEEDKERNLTWVWIVIAVVVIAIAYATARKRQVFSGQ